MHRRGSIFLFILGVMGVLFALAFSLLSSSQLASTSGFETDPEILADQAAREGLGHAIGVIHQEFASGPGIPSQLTDAWRSHFWAIDTHLTGSETSDYGDDVPRGFELNPYDLFENDVHVENLLTEYYAKVDSNRGAYKDRHDIYDDGFYNHPGTGRWYEPGVRSDDPVARPLSFHLDHPAPAQAGSIDPALRKGENYAPDVFEPIRYDAQLQATVEPNRVRYRLRYAAAVEALDGHLLVSLPAEFDPAAVSALSGTPSDDDFSRAMEVDRARAERYAGSLFEMFDRYVNDEQLVDLGFRGLGWQRGGSNNLVNDPPIARFDSSGAVFGWRQNSSSETRTPAEEALPERRVLLERVPNEDRDMNHELLGPIPSFGALERDHWDAKIYLKRHYLCTPFGMAPKVTPAPSAWNEAYVDTPWQVNVPTATSGVIRMMLYAYLPQEFKTGVYEVRDKYTYAGEKETRTGTTADWKADPNNPYALSGDDRRGLKPCRNLFLEMADVAFFDQRGGIAAAADEAYPGTDPDNPGTHWLPSLGAGNAINVDFGRSRVSQLGSSEEYAFSIFSDITEKEEKWLGPPAGEKWIKRRGGEGRPFTEPGGFFYGDSYWLDIANAFTHAMGAVQYAWSDRVSGAYDGDADRGHATWRSDLAGYFPSADAPGFTAGGRCRDWDVDGDGVADVPSTFDTVEEIDRQFLRNLGEYPEDYAKGARPTATNVGLEVGESWSKKPRDIRKKAQTGKNIKGLLAAAAVTPEQAALMELVVNDFRMSFFGASPHYADFRPLDFDDDGTVRCSAYKNGYAPADLATGRGPLVDPATGTEFKRFSLTGYFVFQKTRYYRIFVRGEVFDVVRGVPVAQSNREAVYVVDPDGDVWDLQLQDAGSGTTGMADSHILFERQHRNAYRGFQSHVAR